MKRPLLISCVTVMLFIGVALASSPFIQSMEPSARVLAQRSQHDLSTLDSGDFVIEPSERANAWNLKVLIIRDWDGSIYAYNVPTKNDKVILPDSVWGWGYFYCSDFRPELDSNSKIKKSGLIKCHDTQFSNLNEEYRQWTYDGQSQRTWIEDMVSTYYEIKNAILYVNL